MASKTAARKVTASILGFLRIVWAQIALAFLGGAALIYWAPEKGFWKVIDHIGIGFVVAAIVTLFWQLREMTEFFLSLARSTLIEDDYVRKLNQPSLRRLRSAAVSAAVEDLVTNQKYDWRKLEGWVDEVMFSRLLPTAPPPSGVYRKDYRDSIVLEFVTLRAALSELSAPMDAVPQDALNMIVLKQTITTRYTVVAPRLGTEYQGYPVSLSGKASDMPFIETKSRVRYYVGNREQDAVEVPVRIVDIPRGGIEYEARREVSFVNGEAHVWTKRVTYVLPASEPFIVETMSHMTDGARVHLSATGTDGRIVFDGDMIGFGGTKNIEYLANGLELEYGGWLFEDHGYIIWWWNN